MLCSRRKGAGTGIAGWEFAIIFVLRGASIGVAGFSVAGFGNSGGGGGGGGGAPEKEFFRGGRNLSDSLIVGFESGLCK